MKHYTVSPDLEDKLRDFIKSHEFLTLNRICNVLRYDPGNFNNWLNGNRPLPIDIQASLAGILMDYGYTSGFKRNKDAGKPLTPFWMENNGYKLYGNRDVFLLHDDQEDYMRLVMHYNIDQGYWGLALMDVPFVSERTSREVKVWTVGQFLSLMEIFNGKIED